MTLRSQFEIYASFDLNINKSVNEFGREYFLFDMANWTNKLEHILYRVLDFIDNF